MDMFQIFKQFFPEAPDIVICLCDEGENYPHAEIS